MISFDGSCCGVHRVTVRDGSGAFRSGGHTGALVPRTVSHVGIGEVRNTDTSVGHRITVSDSILSALPAVTIIKITITINCAVVYPIMVTTRIVA